MKVLQIIDKLDVGGAERVTVNMANIFFENSVDISVLCLLDKSLLDDELNPKIPILYLKRKNKFSVSKLAELFKILRKYDIIHIHSRHVLRYVGLLLFFPKLILPFKVVYQDHSLLQLSTSFKDKRFLMKLLRKVNAIIVVTEEQKDIFSTPTPIFVLENIVRKTTWEFSTDPERKKLVAIGNFLPIKNYSFMFEIFEKLPVEYSLDIYSNSIDKEYFEKNKPRFEKWIMDKRVQIITAECNLQKLLPNYSLALHTSLSETGPLVALECLSVGLPILMYGTGAVSKKIKQKIPELVKDNTEAQDWANTIISYHSNPEKMRNFSSILKGMYVDTYSEKKYYQQCIAIYRHILNF